MRSGATSCNMPTLKTPTRLQRRHRLHRVVERVQRRRRTTMESRIRDLRQRITATSKRGKWRAEDLIREVRDAV